MKRTLSISQVGLRSGKSYNQVMRDVLCGNLRGFQDERGRWHVEVDSADAHETGSSNPADGFER